MALVDKAQVEWFGPCLSGRELGRIEEVLRRNYINDGPMTKELERHLAEVICVKHCIAVTSGTAALAVAMMALDIGPGDEVIVPDLTFVATANAIKLAGASVKLVDIEPARFCIDPEALRGAIGPRTRAIIAVDVNGRGAAYDLLEPICAKHGLALICDAAEALGSRYRGRALGAYGDVACFSFSANKTITSGQGGMIATNRDDLNDRIRELKDQGRRHGGTGGGDDVHPVVGFNFKYTDLQAAVALAQLDELDHRLASALARDRAYFACLGNLPGLRFPSFEEPGEVRQWMDLLIEDTPSVTAALKKERIEFRTFWRPLHEHAPYTADPKRFPVSTEISNCGLWLPSRFDLTEDQIRTTADAVCAGLAASHRARSDSTSDQREAPPQGGLSP